MENTNHNIIPQEHNDNTNSADQEQEPSFEIDRLTVEEIIAINLERKTALQDCYDPIAGIGCCGPRVERELRLDGEIQGKFLIPQSMAAELDSRPCRSMEQWQRLRIKHDFEYWCATCVTILDKVSGRLQNMVLNKPQRRVLRELEKQRLDNKPLRLILLKARQWGGSTLVQIYMAWIQLVLKSNWNSLICGHLHQTSQALKAMYRRVLRNYPKHLTDDGNKVALKTFEGCANVQQLSGSDSLVIAGSAQSQDAIRGYDVKMAHLSEVAFWPCTKLHSPEDVIRSIAGSIPMEPLTMIVLESTANGVGNYFHQEWLRSKSKMSDKAAVFVPWYEIEIYRMEVADVSLLIAEMDNYEKWLWESCGCTLEMINWYHHKRKEYPTQSLMAAEFPSTDIEAFTSTSNKVFATEIIDRMRHGNVNPMQRGDMVARGAKTLEGVDFVINDAGPMELWKRPVPSRFRNRYVVVVDVGGRSDNSDWSVIAVFDRNLDTGDDNRQSRPEVVAQWRGHLDHDELAWKAAQIAFYYNKALLVFESNTLECEGDVGNLIFQQIKAVYPNLYHRKGNDGQKGEPKPGFQTNKKTKQSAIYNLIAYARDGSYIERDKKAVDEMAFYELKPNGKGYGARKGKHDDILMTRAIGLMLIEEMRVNEGRSRAINPNYFVNNLHLSF